MPWKVLPNYHNVSSMELKDNPMFLSQIFRWYITIYAPNVICKFNNVRPYVMLLSLVNSSENKLSKHFQRPRI